MFDCLKVWLGNIPEDWLREDRPNSTIQLMEVIIGCSIDGYPFFYESERTNMSRTPWGFVFISFLLFKSMIESMIKWLEDIPGFDLINSVI